MVLTFDIQNGIIIPDKYLTNHSQNGSDIQCLIIPGKYLTDHSQNGFGIQYSELYYYPWQVPG